MHCRPGRQHPGIRGADPLVAELHAHRRQHLAARAHVDVVVIPGGFLVNAVRFDNRQSVSLCLHRSIIPAGLAEQIGPADFEPHEVVRVIDDAHFVGFGVAHPDPGERRWGAHRTAAAPSAAALSSRVARSGSGVLKIADPATKIRAPAATRRAILCRSTPPSISIGAGLPAASSSARTSPSLDSLRGMKVWPPKPGFTDMTRTKSTSAATSLIATTGVPGLITTPALMPCALIACTVRCTCGSASTWTEIIPAPASAKASMKRSAFSIIRWTSSGTVAIRFSDLTTGTPMVMFGTKWPSITST